MHVSSPILVLVAENKRMVHPTAAISTLDWIIQSDCVPSNSKIPLTFADPMPSVSLVLCSERGLVELEATKLTQQPMASLPSSVTMLTTSCSS